MPDGPERFFPNYPGPFEPGGRRPSAPLVPPAPLDIKFPPTPDPVTEVVFDSPVSSVGPHIGRAFAWPRGTPLGIRARNNTNQLAFVEVFVGNAQDPSDISDQAAITIEVSPNGGRQQEALDPGAGDPWGPWAWPIIRMAAPATRGNVRVEFSRVGG